MFEFFFWGGKPVPVPLLTVVAYSGTVASIPAGWGLCDGSVYALSPGPGSVTTPNLNNTMLVGANGTTLISGTFYTGTQATALTDVTGSHSPFIGGGVSNGGPPFGANVMPNTPINAGDHSHTILGSYDTLFPPSTEVCYICSIDETAKIPVGAVIPFTNLAPGGATVSNSGKYLAGVTNNSRLNIGSNTKVLTWSFIAGGGHGHNTLPGPDTGSGCPCNANYGGSTPHTHPFTVAPTAATITLNDPSYIVLQYGTLTAPAVGRRQMVLGTLQSGAITDWADCDGTGGTPDVRGRYIRGRQGAEALFDTGGNTSVDTTLINVADFTLTAIDWIHDHSSAGASSISGGGPTYHSNASAGFHNHTVVSTGADNLPPTYAIRFITRA